MAAAVETECTMDSIDWTELPRDSDDGRYIQSFPADDLAAVKEFFQEFGFVVVRDVFDKEACGRTVEAMWEVCENQNPGLCRGDASSWRSLKVSGKYGLSSRGPCFHRQLVHNRQSPTLRVVLKSLVGSEVLVSQDRFTIYRSTVLGGDAVSTGPRNIHLDLNPWWWLQSAEEVLAGVETLSYANEQDFIKENNLVVKAMGRHVQCVLNFTDNLEEDGGTIVVPKFHKYIARWCADNESMRKPIPWLTMPLDTPLLSLAQRIPMKEGSVLIWDQTVFHGTAPNYSERCRTAQYLKAFPMHLVSKDRLQKRSSALRRILEDNGLLEYITVDGASVFGL